MSKVEGSRIEGWKSIAVELGVSEKTARKLARKEGLPVLVDVRPLRFYIERADLKAWRDSRPAAVPYLDFLALESRTGESLRAA